MVRHTPTIAPLALVAALTIGGCCGDPPRWADLEPLVLDSGAGSVELLDWIIDDRGDLEFDAASDDPGLIAYADGSTLELQAQPGWQGVATVALTAWDECGNEASTTVEVQVGEVGDDDDDTVDPFVDPCGVTFVYEPQGHPDAVAVAGTFNDWSTETHRMDLQPDGSYALYVDGDELPPGAYPYKFVEISGSSEGWACDPHAALIHCDEGYKDPHDNTWAQDCSLGADSCNSMVVVTDYDAPRLLVERLDIDHAGGTVSLEVSFAPGCAGDEAAAGSATLDGTAIESAWTGDGFQVDLDGLSEGRHTLRLRAEDGAGRQAEEVYVPLWIEAQDGWQRGVMYYAFVDRFVNGDRAIDGSEGAGYELSSYMGGDLQGVIDALDYLEDLGVNVIWLSNPQDNAEGAWEGDCADSSAYHGYWPDDPYAVEEHFGGEDALRDLVEAAHARQMRVVMDWVGNHVHQDHPYYRDHGDTWFNEPVMCRVGDDYSNFDDIPEVCWFAEYLPDIRYYEPEPLVQMVEDALWWITTYDLDGFRVDGAKHVPHSVLWNVTSRIDQLVEHAAAGGTTEFYTVGETFSFDRQWIVTYVNDHELDAQFDFPLYGAVRSALVDDGTTMRDLSAARADSDATYGGALMSTFLGNHDVSRFTSYGEVGGWADSSESACSVADVVGDDWWLQRLALAFTFLMTSPGLPLIYYGDEIGMPGYHDPDNRHPLWWYSATLNEDGPGPFGLDEYAAGLYHPQMGEVLDHVAALGAARRAHPALWSGDETEWWIDDDTWGYARVSGDDAALVILHRGWQDTTLDNGLEFAGLPADATYVDLLSGETFTAAGDAISIPMRGNSSRVLVVQ